MKISAITVSVDYAEYLEQSIPVWRETVDDLLVITSTHDSKTMTMCSRTRTKFIATSVFYANGAIFNKAAALDIGYAKLNPKDWVLSFDADIVPKANWRAKLPELEIGRLYGAKRHHESGLEIHDEAAGFFLLFHSSDPLAAPGFGSWKHAGAYDTEFVHRWPALKREKLPLNFKHLGTPGNNWCGMNRTDLMIEMFRERMEHGGTWEHERLV